MKQFKATKQPNPHARHILVQFKVNAIEMRTLLAKSGMYTKRNLSAFLRYAALNFKPSKEDFQK